MLEGITTIPESNQVTRGLLFGYTTEQIDTIIDRVEKWANDSCFGC